MYQMIKEKCCAPLSKPTINAFEDLDVIHAFLSGWMTFLAAFFTNFRMVLIVFEARDETEEENESRVKVQEEALHDLGP